jgi:hypothetical protein
VHEDEERRYTGCITLRLLLFSHLFLRDRRCAIAIRSNAMHVDE